MYSHCPVSFCPISQRHDPHAEASSTEECCSRAVETSVCLRPRCCLSKLSTGLACGPLLSVNQVCKIFHLSLPVPVYERVSWYIFLGDPGHIQAFVRLRSGFVSSWSLSCHLHRLVSEWISPGVGLAYGYRHDGMKKQLLL